MWIVRLALNRPYTFVVLSLLLLIVGPIVVLNTSVDIFPNIDIPVVSVVWTYAGLSPQEMTDRIVSPFERSVPTLVNDVDHSESQVLNGVSVTKMFFRPSVKIAQAVAQVTAAAQTVMRQLPPGATPPLVIQYSASSVPIIQLSLSGKGMNEQQLNDIAMNFMRTQLSTVQGASIPWPYGGKIRQIQVDIDTTKLQAYGLSASDVVNAVNAQNVILPSGDAKMGDFDWQIESNSAPRTIAALNNLPIRTMNGATIYLRDVGNVWDGFPPQTNLVRVNGQRATLLTVYKTGNSSTLDIISAIRATLPSILAELPRALRVHLISDQSIFVRAAISGVVREAIIAAVLTALMILVFLGSWRSSLIIAVSIPLSVITSLILLPALGQTINIMTLGGLALAVGILVDDATVAIENIDRNLEEGKKLEQAILDGSAQIAVPAFVSTLSICIVFVPMFFLNGVARYLFVPMAEAVVFAMLASYFFSRTIVPTMAKYLLKGHEILHPQGQATSKNPFVRFQQGFEHGFESLRHWYREILVLCLAQRGLFLLSVVLFWAVSLAVLTPWLGQDFFPSVDGGQFELHVRAHTGTRIENTARICDAVESVIRKQIPAGQVESIIDNIGVPYSGMNLSYSNSATVGTEDANVTVSLSRDHRPTAEYVHSLRKILNRQFPGVEFYFLPTDMVSQILNFGLPAQMDMQLVGQQVEANRVVAEHLMQRFARVPGVTDLRIQQPFNLPTWRVDVNRTRAQQAGYTDAQVASDLLIGLSGSFQTTPNFYLDPRSHIAYDIAVQTPQYDVKNLQELENFPVAASGSGAPPQILGNLASIERTTEQATVSHYDARPVIDIYGTVEGTDLGTVARKLDRIIAQSQGELPRGTQVFLRGQVQTMRSSYTDLFEGLAFSIVLVYALIVVNFQSWLDPFIIIAALPGALAGIVWMLFLTRTYLSVPALTGAIMCVGIATANSILVVSFAKDQMETGMNATEAALTAGFTRFRPVLMTALAMIIGMVPMALGLGEGGEENAPLGRAVIGGLILATIGTLTFVPSFFAFMHRHDTQPASQAESDAAPGLGPTNAEQE